MAESGVAGAAPSAGDGAPEPHSDALSVSPKHKIVAGAAMVAVLAGVAVTAIDYPWNFGNTRPSRRAAEHREAHLPPLALKPSLAAASAGEDAQGRKDKPRETPAAKPAKNAKPAKTRSPLSSAQSQIPRPDVPVARTRPAQSIDARYQALVKARCAKGLRGLACREEVRWQLCRGRWNLRGAGASSCRVNSTETLWSSTG